jgi:hypothetical protein
VIDRTLKSELNAPVSIIGEGIYATRLVFINGAGADGFSFRGTFVGQSSELASIEFQNLAILKSGQGGAAIVLGSSTAGATPASYPRFRLDNVYFSGANFDANYWQSGLVLDRAVHGTITRCHFRGFRNEPRDRMLYGVNIKSYAGDVCISASFFQVMACAVHNQAGEGVTVDNCRLVDVLTGVHSEGGTMLTVSNNRVSAHESGVKATQTNSTVITHNLFYHREGTSSFCNMIELVQASDAIIDGNTFGDNSVARMNAIVLKADTAVVTGNLLSATGRDHVERALWIKPDSVDVRAHGNKFFGKVSNDAGEKAVITD